jgi:hypothetical protein
MIKHEAKYPVPPVTHTVPLSPSISLSLSKMSSNEIVVVSLPPSLVHTHIYGKKETCQLLFLSFFINVVSTSLSFFF